MAFEKHLERSHYFKSNYNIVVDPLWYGGKSEYNPFMIMPTKLKLKGAMRLKI